MGQTMQENTPIDYCKFDPMPDSTDKGDPEEMNALGFDLSRLNGLALLLGTGIEYKI